jgi:hypothetical protein
LIAAGIAGRFAGRSAGAGGGGGREEEWCCTQRYGSVKCNSTKAQRSAAQQHALSRAKGKVQADGRAGRSGAANGRNHHTNAAHNESLLSLQLPVVSAQNARFALRHPNSRARPLSLITQLRRPTVTAHLHSRVCHRQNGPPHALHTTPQRHASDPIHRSTPRLNPCACGWST